MIDLLKDLIRIKSDSIEGANEALLYCQSWLLTRGIAPKLYEHDSKLMLVAEIGDGDECIIWNGHVDVVPGNPDQFTPFIDGDKLFGRGSADMKAGVAAMMQAFYELSLTTENLTKKVQLHIVTDEETVGDTSNYLVNKGFNGDFVICGEPTQLHIGLQAKGIVQVDIKIKGKSSHGSRPWEGVNAIERAFAFDNEMRKLSFMKASNRFYDYPSLNLAKIHAGERYNVVPDECVLSYDIRFVPGQNIDDILIEIQNMRKNHFPNCEILVHSTAPAVTTDENDKYVMKLQNVTSEMMKRPTNLFGQHGSADTRFYSEKGAGAIEFGPCGADWHGDMEYVSISSMEQYKNILVSFIVN
ncbi:M20 family metallopeptidase [Psychrobacillus vulpis]|uniref:M20 family metallopeptidase n=1 Tax=Psychrobacillus vulpis TaxID=2325572 RepID=A0A544TPL8_9BACI|nr:M20/M25/M40 family metallo-hydrolase [Psychrobacillus vulpis]TQR19342.1 M20 family metallopeptidase [Psychrobacillus vulpis]